MEVPLYYIQKYHILPEILHCILIMLHNYESNIDRKLFNPFKMVDSLDARPDLKTHYMRVLDNVHNICDSRTSKHNIYESLISRHTL